MKVKSGKIILFTTFDNISQYVDTLYVDHREKQTFLLYQVQRTFILIYTINFPDQTFGSNIKHAQTWQTADFTDKIRPKNIPAKRHVVNCLRLYSNVQNVEILLPVETLFTRSTLSVVNCSQLVTRSTSFVQFIEVILIQEIVSLFTVTYRLI